MKDLGGKILLVALGGVIGYLLAPKRTPEIIVKDPPPPKVIYVDRPVPVLDSVPYVIPITFRDSIPVPMTLTAQDSAEIVRVGLSTYYLVDSISDSDLRAVISDSIRGSRIVSRRFQYEILRPETLISVDSSRKGSGLYLGLSGSVNRSRETSLAIDLGLVTPRGDLVRLSYGLDRSIALGLAKRINFSRK